MPPQETVADSRNENDGEKKMVEIQLNVNDSLQNYYNPKESSNTVNLEAHKVVEESPKKSTMDFDDMLPHLGEFGLYQKILFLMMIPFAFFVSFVYFTQIFITLVPEQHWCSVPELHHLSLEQR